jgi:hypothetical protein
MLTPEAKTDCVNLRETFGKRCRIGWDPAYEPRHVAKENHDPWMMQIPCKRGIIIYPQGDKKLAVECNYHPQIARQLGSIPGVELTQDGTHEKTFVFHVSLFDQIAAIVKPKRRRQLTERHRTILAVTGKAALEKYRHKTNSGDQISELEPLGKR